MPVLHSRLTMDTATLRDMLRTISICLLLGAVALSATARAGAQAASALPLPLRLTAFAVNMSNIGPGAAGIVEIRITQWSTEAERKRVVETMVEKGQDALLKLLQDLPAKGRFRLPNKPGPDRDQLRLGWDIRYAWHTPVADGGYRIVVGMDRYMSFQEVRNQPRTVDYPFTLIEIRLNKDGEGEGKLAYATRITFDKKKNAVELENYSSEPVRLTTVKIEKG
jgi:hypothetical protein